MSDTEFEFSTEERLAALIETLDSYISAYHGGSVQMVGFDGKTLQVRLGGACKGCTLSPSTLNGWVAVGADSATDMDTSEYVNEGLP